MAKQLGEQGNTLTRLLRMLDLGGLGMPIGPGGQAARTGRLSRAAGKMNIPVAFEPSNLSHSDPRLVAMKIQTKGIHQPTAMLRQLAHFGKDPYSLARNAQGVHLSGSDAMKFLKLLLEYYPQLFR